MSHNNNNNDNNFWVTSHVELGAAGLNVFNFLVYKVKYNPVYMYKLIYLNSIPQIILSSWEEQRCPRRNGFGVFQRFCSFSWFLTNLSNKTKDLAYSVSCSLLGFM